jgi:hypothetical protein
MADKLTKPSPLKTLVVAGGKGRLRVSGKIHMIWKDVTSSLIWGGMG